MRGFLSTTKRFMLKISVKRHVLRVLYSIRQHDTPKSRDSRAVFLKSRESRALDQKVGKRRKSRDTGQPAKATHIIISTLIIFVKLLGQYGVLYDPLCVSVTFT